MLNNIETILTKEEIYGRILNIAKKNNNILTPEDIWEFDLKLVSGPDFQGFLDENEIYLSDTRDLDETAEEFLKEEIEEDVFVEISKKEQVSDDGFIGNSLSLYLKEIGKIKLLSFEEEQELGKRIAMGDKEAGKELVTSNLRLVINISKHFIGRGLSFEDLIQEGNCGLIKAVDKFNYELGFKFSTYATWWIRQTITRAISDTSRIIRLPVHIGACLNKLNSITKKLTVDLGRDPSEEEIATEMKITVDKVQEYKRVAQQMTSLDTPVSGDSSSEGETSLGDFIEDEKSQNPEEMAIQEMLKDDIKSVLYTLADRERQVIEMRFGLYGQTPKTLEEVGKEFNVTRERIRQIEAKAIRKLRHPSRATMLEAYSPTNKKSRKI